jgi:hypothetical protein
MRDRDGAAVCVLWLLVAATAPAVWAPVPAVTSPAVEAACDGPVTGSVAPCAAPGETTGPAPDPSARVTPPRSVREVGVTTVHDRGVTGEGVDVGVIGAAFDPDRAGIDDQVDSRTALVARRPDAGAAAHGTAVAELVAETAPDADLHLVDVGRNPSPERYESAVHRLLRHDVEVIVDSGSYFPRDPETADRIAAVARRASARGVVFVTSAGNSARRHWEGTGTERGWVSFAEGVEANPLGGGEPVRGVVSLRLRWNTTADYDLYLYRRVPGDGGRVVAASTARGADAEAIDVAVPRGTYYVAVYAHEGGSRRDRVELFAARHALGYATGEGGVVAPGTSEAVLTVGALSSRSGSVRPYSSRGPAVDVGVPDGAETRAAGEFEGTSAAAPVAAGTAALMASQNRSLSPRTVEAILERTAAGHGRLDAVAAVQAVSAEPAGTRSRAGSGAWGDVTPSARSDGPWPATGDADRRDGDPSGTARNDTVDRDGGPSGTRSPADTDRANDTATGTGATPTPAPTPDEREPGSRTDDEETSGRDGTPTATPTPTPSTPEEP